MNGPNRSEAGWAAAGLGDTDGDEAPDLAISAPQTSNGGGAVYVLRGGSIGGKDRLVTLEEANHKVYSDTVNWNTGHGVAGTGDIDGDGLGDLLLARGPTDEPSAAGAYLFRGPISGQIYIEDADTVVYKDGERPTTGALGVSGGTGVSAEGAVEHIDIDGDGLADVLIGAPEKSDDDSPTSGYILLSDGLLSEWERTFSLCEADVRVGIADIAEEAAVEMTAADLDADGRHDLLVGLPINDNAGEDAGAVFALLTTDALSEPSGTVLASQANGWIVGETSSRLGASVSPAGDFDQDGSTDLLIGAPGGNGGTGVALVIFGVEP